MTSLRVSYLKLNNIMKLSLNSAEYTNLRNTPSSEEQQALKQLKQREASKTQHQKKRQSITFGDSASDSDQHEKAKTATLLTHSQHTCVKTPICETSTNNR